MPCSSLFRQRTSRASDACRAHNQHPKLLCGRLPLTPNFHDLAKLCAGHHTSIGAWRRAMLRGNEAELVAARALNELPEFKLEPGAATLAAHLVQLLHRDRTPLLFVDFYAAFGCTLRWHDAHIYSSAELREVARIAGPFLHGQIPHCAGYFPRDADERQPPAQGRSTELTLVLG